MSDQREWKPGDVAIRISRVSQRQMRTMLVAGCRIGAHGLGEHWHHGDGGWDPLGGKSTYRPLVVIDPEDREQLERLARVYREQTHAELGPYPMSLPTYRMQGALREFANPTPPKPDEPLGLGAVVEDEDGSLLIRNGVTGDRPWVTIHGASFGWREIDLARVLSPGYTEDGAS